MAKSLQAPYEAGNRGASWLKIKRAHTLDLIVLAAEWGHGRRTGKLSNLHLGALDPRDRASTSCWARRSRASPMPCSTGRRGSCWRARSGAMPGTVYVRPELVVEIAFSDLQASPRYPGGLALRLARVKRYRDDKRARDADTMESVRRIYAAQGGVRSDEHRLAGDARATRRRPPRALRHELRRRHMTMIALGGVIGAGLFVGSGVVIKSAGPAAVLSFVITGLLVVLVMRMLGEMAVAVPAVGSFYEYARLAWSDRPALGDLAGFLTRLDVLVFLGHRRGARGGRRCRLGSLLAAGRAGLADQSGAAGRAHGDQSVLGEVVRRVRVLVRLHQGGRDRRVPGWWAGCTCSACGREARVHVANLTAHGGFAPNGMLPVLTGAVAATGFYFGAEIVTVAAAEAAEPAKAVADATNWVISRALFFYVGSILLVVCLVPWNSPGISTPYVSALEAMGIPAAAQIMNAVVLTAVLSALNSGLYASSRMLFALTRRGDAPQRLAKLEPQRRADPGHPAGHAVRLCGGGHVLCLARYRICLPGQFLRHRGDIRLCADRRFAAAPARAAGAGGAGAAAGADVGLPLPHLLGDRGMLGIVVAMAFIPDQRTPLVFGLLSVGILAARVHAAPQLGSRNRLPATVEFP